MNELPQELAIVWDKIMSYVEPYVDLELKYSRDVLPVDTSKVGGLPFLPIGMPYPVDYDNNYLFLLAQINFAELPHLEGYPTDGLLQWYISPFDDDYGCSTGDVYEKMLIQKDYHILYWTADDLKKECITDFDAVTQQWKQKKDTFMVPIVPSFANFAIKGTLKNMLTIEFNQFFDQALNVDSFQPKDLLTFQTVMEKHGIPMDDFFVDLDELDDEEVAAFFENQDSSRDAYESREKAIEEYMLYLQDHKLIIDIGIHRIGGWADCVQGDPLQEFFFMPDSVLLLQLGVHIESVKDQNDVRLEFGENAIAHLFITPQNLAKLNFSRVLYTWDCC